MYKNNLYLYIMTKKFDRYLLTYTGNKYRETKKYLEDLDIKKYDIIVEPFGGIFGYSRALYEMNPNYSGEFWINDTNTDLIGVHQQLKDGKFNEIKEMVLKLIEPFEKDENDLNFNKVKKKNSLLQLIVCFYINTRQKMKNKIKNYEEKQDDFKELLDKCSFFNMDFNDFLKQLPTDKKCLILFDPPYFDSCNTDYTRGMEKYEDDGEIKDNTQMYLDILDYFAAQARNLQNRKTGNDCLMIINNLSIMRYIFKDFQQEVYKVKYQRVKKNTSHLMIYNFKRS